VTSSIQNAVALWRPRATGVRLVRALATLVTAIVLLLLGDLARAQALDDVRLISDGPDAVLQVRFNVRVQYQRHAPLAAADLIEIYFQLLGNDDALTRPIEETLSVAGKDPAPDARVTYPVQTGLPVKKIIVKLGRKVDFRVRAGSNNQMLEIILPGLAPRIAVAPSAPPAIVESDRYAITLQSLPLGDQASMRAIPARLQDYTVFGSEMVRDGVRYYELVLGYFNSQADAEKVLATVLADFPSAKVFDTVQRKEQNLQVAAKSPEPPVTDKTPLSQTAGPGATAPAEVAAGVAAATAAATAEAAATAAPTASAPTVPAAPPVPDTDLDKQGAGLMAKARAALIGGKNDEAINTLNQLLLLPPNKYSQDAQELIGLARERSGALDLARKEYELYLKLFPTGDGATRVRQRLATMAPPEIAATPAAKPPAEKRAPQYSAGGSVSGYYFGGKQNVQTVFAVPTTVNQQTISNNSQSSLILTADLNGRYRTDSTDTRIVVLDTYQHSFIGDVAPSLNRMDSAYVDYRDTRNGLTVKAGRQSGVTGGLVGRFDGAIVGYDIAPKLHLSAVAGVPVAADQFVDAKRQFEGLSLESQSFAEHWGGSGFIINQTTDSVVDRRAIGGDLRYFDPQKTLYALVDYDTAFATLNAVTLQGTYQLPDQTSVSLLLDDRKAPTLETSNGLLQTGCATIAQYLAQPSHLCPQFNLLNGVTPVPSSPPPYDDNHLRQIALTQAANSHQFALDISRPIGAKWQVSGDLRVSSVGALPTVTINGQTFQGTAATGNLLSAAVQATGSNLYSKRDINVFGLTYLHSSTLDGKQLSYSNLNTFMDNRLSIEPSLSLYWETDTSAQKLSRLSPGVRSSYKVTQRLSVDGTISLERSRTDGPTQNDTTSNIFYYAGFRYDLNH